jgi:hypothetical protein
MSTAYCHSCERVLVESEIVFSNDQHDFIDPEECCPYCNNTVSYIQDEDDEDIL